MRGGLRQQMLARAEADFKPDILYHAVKQPREIDPSLRRNGDAEARQPRGQRLFASLLERSAETSAIDRAPAPRIRRWIGARRIS
jgi:hypothetical protein